MKYLLAKANRWKFLLLAVLPFGIGVCIYFIDRKVMPLLIRNYFPDALWSFAFTNCWFINGDNDTMDRIASLFICLLLIVAVELSQLLQFIPGTFDPLDLIVMLAACLFTFLLVHSLQLLPIRRQIFH